MTWLRRLTHRIVFKHRFIPAVMLHEFEAHGNIACAVCWYYDPRRPVLLFLQRGAAAQRVYGVGVDRGEA